MVFCAGSDFKQTPVEIRERLFPDDEFVSQALKKISSLEGVKGCVIVSTCNRKELYLSADTYINAEKVFLKFCGVSAEALKGRLKTYEGGQTAYHLIETACGVNSAIKGESLIIGQIRESADLSRKNGSIDGELEILFRIAVTTGKKACGGFSDGYRLSAAQRACALAEEKLKSLNGKKCLVIGNGKVGVLGAELFKKKGAEVTITLREYKHSTNIIPAGCGYISYSKRAEAIDGCDILLSATKSPHFTVTEEMTEGLRLPPLIFDLAVPRDIDPQIGKKEGISLFNIDDLVKTDEATSPEVLSLIDEGVREFESRNNFRESAQLIRELKEVIAARIERSLGLDEKTVKAVSEKTVDMLLGAMNGGVSPKLMKECLKKIRERARL